MAGSPPGHKGLHQLPAQGHPAHQLNSPGCPAKVHASQPPPPRTPPPHPLTPLPRTTHHHPLTPPFRQDIYKYVTHEKGILGSSGEYNRRHRKLVHPPFRTRCSLAQFGDLAVERCGRTAVGVGVGGCALGDPWTAV